MDKQNWWIDRQSPALPPGDYVFVRKEQVQNWGVRVIIIVEQKVLLVRHNELNAKKSFWLFPGGGIELGETIAEAGQRETKEETGLDVDIQTLLYIRELNPGEIEFYVLATNIQGKVILGTDPEKQIQVLADVAWKPLNDLQRDKTLNLYPQVLQSRLECDYISGWPSKSVLFLGVAK